MLAFPEMIVPAAEMAGIKVPSDLYDYDPNDFVAWHVFQTLQLGASMPHPSAHWINAEIIFGFTDEELKTMLYADFLAAGIEIGRPIP